MNFSLSELIEVIFKKRENLCSVDITASDWGHIHFIYDSDTNFDEDGEGFCTESPDRILPAGRTWV